MCKKVTSANCKDDRIISKTLNEATRMTLKYLDGEECADAAKKLGKFEKVVYRGFIYIYIFYYLLLYFFLAPYFVIKIIDYTEMYAPSRKYAPFD